MVQARGSSSRLSIEGAERRSSFRARGWKVSCEQRGLVAELLVEHVPRGVSRISREEEQSFAGRFSRGRRAAAAAPGSLPGCRHSAEAEETDALRDIEREAAPPLPRPPPRKRGRAGEGAASSQGGAWRKYGWAGGLLAARPTAGNRTSRGRHAERWPRLRLRAPAPGAEKRTARADGRDHAVHDHRRTRSPSSRGRRGVVRLGDAMRLGEEHHEKLAGGVEEEIGERASLLSDLTY